jgi:hypothetical protein
MKNISVSGGDINACVSAHQYVYGDAYVSSSHVNANDRPYE